MNYQQVIEEVYTEVQSMGLKGKLPDYIPELKNVNPDCFGICLVDAEGNAFGVGDYETKFSIQSISKVFTLTMAFSLLKGNLWKRVNVEPSGNPFNSLVQLEYEKGIPRNPFINAGALVITDVIESNFRNPKEAILNFVKSIGGEESIEVNHKVWKSELNHSSRNKAVANFMQSFHNLENKVDDIIDTYTYHCSIEMNCRQLAKAFLLFVNDGYSIYSKQQVLDESSTKRLNALMLTCGFYDEAGEFAFKVGLPGKSGVGGGVVAVLPEKFSVAVWSPELNSKGNSLKSIMALELLTTKLNFSLF